MSTKLPNSWNALVDGLLPTPYPLLYFRSVRVCLQNTWAFDVGWGGALIAPIHLTPLPRLQHLYQRVPENQQVWCKLPRKVSYKRTFGVPDQGQTLNVCHWHSADVNTEVVVTPGVTTSPQKDTLNTTRYLRRNLCRSMRSHELDLRMDPVQWSPCTLTPL